MKTLGILLLVVGSLWALVAFNADTTVSTESQFIGSTYIPSQKVHNIGKMDERRNHLMLSALAIVVGVILFAVGKVKTPSTPTQSDTSASPNAGNRKCPFCAEFVKAEAVICRFCQKELPPLPPPEPSQTVQAINDLVCPPNMPIAIWRENVMKAHDIQMEGESYVWNDTRYASFNSVITAMKAPSEAESNA